jgi:hypothetical protein
MKQEKKRRNRKIKKMETQEPLLLKNLSWRSGGPKYL